MNNSGLSKEEQIISIINNKRFKELDGHWKYILNKIFGYIKHRTKIYADKTIKSAKPNIYIKVDKTIRNILVKTADSEFIHEENIYEFCKFLKSIGITNRTINTVLLFHFGDGTNNGGGSVRYYGWEVNEKLKDRIKEANEELNNNDVIALVADRVMLIGNNSKEFRVDYILYKGEKNENIISRHQLIKYLYGKKFDSYNNLHIGPFLLFPHARYPHEKPILDDKARREVVVTWPNLINDLIYVYKHFAN